MGLGAQLLSNHVNSSKIVVFQSTRKICIRQSHWTPTPLESGVPGSHLAPNTHNFGIAGPKTHQNTREIRVMKLSYSKIREKYEEIRVVKLSYSKIREKYGRNASRNIVVFQKHKCRCIVNYNESHTITFLNPLPL